MSTYEDTLLAARFAALAPEPLPEDWDDVLDRAGVTRTERRPRMSSRALQDRRRRRLVALAVAVLVVAVGTAAAYGVRAFLPNKGFIGLPPQGATPSAPETGELVLSFNGRSATLPLHGRRTTSGGHPIGPMAAVYVYADGRVILQREGGAPGGANERTSGLLEQRLSPDGVDLLLSEVLSTGLFDHELELLREHGFAGTIQARNGDRLVRVYWANRRPPEQILDPQQYPDTPATPEQERALERLDALLTDPAASLPASAWQDREIRAYVPSRYAVCWGHRPEQSPDQPTPSIPPSRVLNLLPAAVADLLRHRGYVPWNGGGPLPPGNPPEACSVVPTEEARTVAQALSAAGLEERGGGEGRGSESLGRLTYRFKAPDARPGHVYIYFEPTLPHGEWTCTPCG